MTLYFYIRIMGIVPNNGVVAIVYPRPSPIKKKIRTPNIQDHLSFRPVDGPQFVPPLYYLYTFILVIIFPYCYFVYPVGSVGFGPGLACWACHGSLAWAGLNFANEINKLLDNFVILHPFYVIVSDHNLDLMTFAICFNIMFANTSISNSVLLGVAPNSRIFKFCRRNEKLQYTICKVICLNYETWLCHKN